jgi:hypothetical protein
VTGDPFRFSQLKHWQAALILFFSSLALFWNFLSPSGHLILSKMGEDLSGQFVWWRQFGFDELKKGHLTLWNPQLFGGEPYFGGFQSALLYPPNWLFMVLPLPFAINSSIAFHIFMAGFFTYCWIKFRGSHPASALMAAFMFMFGASMILHVVPGHLPNLCTMAWIPLVFLSVDICYQKEDFRWVLLSMFALAMQIFSGHIQYVYYTVILLSFYVLFLLIKTKVSKESFVFRLGFIGLGAGALSAVQLLAGWAAASESARTKVLDIDFIDIADITAERLWCLLMPDFFGGWKNYWGGGFYWEGPVYVSLTAFVLALLGFLISKQPDKKFFGVATVVLVLVGVGKRSPIFVLFYKYFPLFNSFRGVGKLNIFITLCLTVLTAMGMDEIFKNSENLQKLKNWTIKASGVFLLVSLIFYAALLLGGQKLFKNYIDHAGSMALSLLLCAAILSLIALVARGSIKKPVWNYGFLVLVFAELFLFAKSNLPFFDLNDLRQEVSAIQNTYQRDPGDYRIYSGENNLVMGSSGWGVWGNDPMVPARYDEFATLTHSLNGQTFGLSNPLQNNIPALGLFRLKYAFFEQESQLKEQKLNLSQVPRAFIVSQWQSGFRESNWLQVLSPQFKPLKQVWLEQDPGIPNGLTEFKGSVSLNDLSSDKVEIRVEIKKPAILVITDNYSRYWKAMGYPDSAESSYSVMPANGFQRAIPLLAGKHHILMEYRPDGFVIGTWISEVSWILFIGFLILAVFCRRRPKGFIIV